MYSAVAILGGDLESESNPPCAGCRQPYITHSKQLEVCLKAIDSALLHVEDVIVSARSESSHGEASAGLSDLHQAYAPTNTFSK